MTATALTCPWCGAPLPVLAPGQTLAKCTYCGATASLTGARATRATPAMEPPAPAIPTADPALQQRVVAAFGAARQRGATPYDALVAAARERLGAIGETDAFARVCLALARDFDAGNGTRVVDDAVCMGRLIEVYLKAIEAVRLQGRYDVNMPFFTATPQGPKDFTRTLDADVIATLAARDPKEKKKGFWPFS